MVAWRAGLVFTAAGRRVIVLGVAAGFTMVFAFPDALQGVMDRFGSDDTDGRFKQLFSLIPPIALTSERYPLMGLGTGMMQSFRQQLNVPVGDYVPEVDLVRIMVELGAVGYLLVWTAKLGLIVGLWKGFEDPQEGGTVCGGGRGGLVCAADVVRISHVRSHVHSALLSRRRIHSAGDRSSFARRSGPPHAGERTGQGCDSDGATRVARRRSARAWSQDHQLTSVLLSHPHAAVVANETARTLERHHTLALYVTGIGAGASSVGGRALGLVAARRPVLRNRSSPESTRAACVAWPAPRSQRGSWRGWPHDSGGRRRRCMTPCLSPTIARPPHSLAVVGGHGLRLRGRRAGHLAARDTTIDAHRAGRAGAVLWALEDRWRVEWQRLPGAMDSAAAVRTLVETPPQGR